MKEYEGSVVRVGAPSSSFPEVGLHATMLARAEDAARVLSREQPTTAGAAVPAPANNGSADAEGVEIPAPEPSGNKNLL